MRPPRETPPSSGKQGFSLVEILVAVTIAAIVGGAILAVIPGAFDAVGNATSTVRRASAADTFDALFARDFASMIPELGFDGDATHCAFWTMRETAPAEFELRHVSYERGKSGIRLWETPAPDYFSQAGTNAFPFVPLPLPDSWARSRFGDGTEIETVPAPFTFSGTNATDTAGLGEWQSPTNAPVLIGTALEVRRGRILPRHYLRRTLP